MDQDLSHMDQSILPLHLRQGAIRAKDDKNDRRVQKQTISGIAWDGIEEEDEEEEPDLPPLQRRTSLQMFMTEYLGPDHATGEYAIQTRKEAIMMKSWQFAIRIYPTVAWLVVAVCLLFLFLARYYRAIEPDGQRLLVLKRMLQAEVKVAASLAPAFRIVSTLAFAARSGVLNVSSPYTSLPNVLAPELHAGPAVNFVQVVGNVPSMSRMTVLRPGSLNDDWLLFQERVPAIFAAADPCSSYKQDPMRCFKLNNSALINVPRDAAAMRWQRPNFLTYDGTVPLWVGAEDRVEMMFPAFDITAVRTYAYRLLAFINASNATTPSGGRGPLLAVEVALDLADTSAAIRDAAPEGGATYVCTADGTVVAGSNWLPEAIAMYDPEEGKVMYPSLWDLGLPWASAVTREMVASTRQREGWSGSDIVVARPLAVGDPAGASYRLGLADLRIVSTAPRTVGTSGDFKALVHGAIGVLGAPGVFLLLALVIHAAYATIVACMRRCFQRHWNK
jgi:hypothetical protein